jgi:hypothetical protein
MEKQRERFPVTSVDLQLIEARRASDWKAAYETEYSKANHSDAPHVRQVNIDAFQATLGHRFEMKQARDLSILLKNIREQSGVHQFSVTVSGPAKGSTFGPDTATSDFIQPQLFNGAQLTVSVSGGPDKEFGKKAAYVVAQFLADTRIDQGINLAESHRSPEYDRLLALIPKKRQTTV